MRTTERSAFYIYLQPFASPIFFETDNVLKDACKVTCGYAENDEVFVEVEATSELEGGLNDKQIVELEGIAYTHANALDDMVAAFAHPIYDYLYGESNRHSSLLYTKYAEYKKMKKDCANMSAQQKQYAKIQRLAPLRVGQCHRGSIL